MISRAPTSRAISAQASISQTLSRGLEIVSAIRTRGLISRAFERTSSTLTKSTVTVLIPNEPVGSRYRDCLYRSTLLSPESFAEVSLAAIAKNRHHDRAWRQTTRDGKRCQNVRARTHADK